MRRASGLLNLLLKTNNSCVRNTTLLTSYYKYYSLVIRLTTTYGSALFIILQLE
jgi:hypothetical protein